MIHPLADVEDRTQIHPSVSIWRWTHVRSGAVIGQRVSIGQGCFIDCGAVIGEGSRIQNHVSVYDGVWIGKDVFVGPHVVFTNDFFPRANSPNWRETTFRKTRIEDGASIGAGAVILCGITIGVDAMIAAGALVTRDVAPGTVVKSKRADATRVLPPEILDPTA